MFNSQGAFKPLTKVQKRVLWLFVLVIVLFGFWVELRGALLKTPKTDAGVYFRAAWAVRTGNDIYSIRNSSGWHYDYPPLFAILMVPFADPPHDISRAGYLPYKVSVSLWYVLTLMIGFVGVHTLATALEETSGDPAVRGQPILCQRWWALRILPILILLPAVGRGQVRGQVDMPLVFLVCMAAAALLRGRRFRVGLWLSIATCIKLIPAYLLLLPLWRRDWRTLSGGFAGLVLGMIVIPVVAMGPDKVLIGYQDLYEKAVLATIRGDTHGSRHLELTEITATDSNAPMVVIHNIMYPDRHTRAKVAATGVRMTHWLIAVLLTIITLYAAGWRGSGRWFSGRVESTPREVVFLGALLLVMMVTTPVFHPHNVAMAIPLITVLISITWDKYRYPSIPAGGKLLFWSLVVSHLLTSIDRGIFLYLRDFGLILVTTLLLWAGSIIVLRGTARDLQI